MSALEYVIETLKIEPDEHEDSQSFLQRVAVEIQALDEAAWNALPDDLQGWYNATAEILTEVEEGQDLGDLPELPEGKKAKKGKKPAVVAEAADESESDAESEAPKKRGRPKKEVVEGEEKPKKEPKVKEDRGPTAANIVRELLCENMDLTLDEIMELLPERGVTMQRSSMQVVALNTVRAFEMVVKMTEVKNKAGEVVLRIA